MHNKINATTIEFLFVCIICLVIFKYVCILAMSFVGYVRFAMYCVG